MISFQDECERDGPAIERLLDQAFGADRFARTSYRLRESCGPIEALSIVARRDGELVGTVRFWPIIIRAQDGSGDVPALLLGPIAVDASLRGKGVGVELIRRGLDRADALGHGIVLLVGDASYYGRVGFTGILPRQYSLPGPHDPERLLVRLLKDEARLPEAAAILPASGSPVARRAPEARPEPAVPPTAEEEGSA